MTAASDILTTLATRVAATYIDGTRPAAILLTGSAAEGVSDHFSDLDLIAYYERLPSLGDLASAQTQLGATERRVSSDPEAGSMIVEEYGFQGIECQMAHVTIASWERNMASILTDFTAATTAEKAIMGLLGGVALHGSDLIGRWQTQAETYPDGLAQATVEHHLRFFPLWLAAERWAARDATIFYHQMLVDSSFNLLGVLAGVNHLYFSTFQFKRLHRFVSGMHAAPPRLADRLDELFGLDPVSAGGALERLVEETVTIVEERLPAVDTAAVRRTLGMRHDPWSPTNESS
jgi:hypothetical protein